MSADLDLDAIEQRVKSASIMDFVQIADVDVPALCAALRAERARIQRLRGGIGLLKADMESAYIATQGLVYITSKLAALLAETAEL